MVIRIQTGKDVFHCASLFREAFEGRSGTRPYQNLRQRAALSIELLVATAILLGTVLPLAYSFASEKRFARSVYQHSVAMEIVDGEMETLLVGEWRAFTPGVHEYHVRANAATNLPPGRFLLRIENEKIRLEWRPTGKPRASVVREVKIK